jgi:DNA helicase-2/ATP-dependent DNA helicase PcrA
MRRMRVDPILSTSVDDPLFDPFGDPARIPVAPAAAVEQRRSWGDPDELLVDLNPEQRAAVAHRRGPLLIVAGAGSGKTRVLTHRIAHLIRTGDANPRQILAITFTNKAAGEMRERVEHLLGARIGRSMWVLTFHSACGRILRESGDRLGFTRAFTIYDTSDSDRLLQYVMRDLSIDSKRYPSRTLRAMIGRAKDAMLSPGEYATAVEGSQNPVEKVVSEVYAVYQRRLREANAMDFDDMILNTVTLLRSEATVLEGLRDRFRHVLIDEFQDTNAAQFELCSLLAGGHRNITAVGDVDQSIYAFRGADFRNVGRFEHAFDDATVITLEQNYRSTQTILSAANAVIANNTQRRPKKLWSAGSTGAPIVRFTADTDADEALFVAQEVERLRSADGRRYDDFAVFYRTNAQSRALEELLGRYGVPYQVVGGTRFYERREIKDAIAYLRAAVNPADEVSIKRVVNTPRRGVGDTSVARVEAFARAAGIPLGVALAERIDEVGITGRARSGIADFTTLTSLLASMDASGSGPHEVLRAALEKSSYLAELQADRSIEAQGRIENLEELIGVAEAYALAEPEGGLNGFLEQVALVSDADEIASDDGRVTIMTLHTAKGLEYPIVFLTGLEEGVFPHMRSISDADALEEERRLCYVGITRAREHLYVTHALTRIQFGTTQWNPASRFLSELPGENVSIAQGSSGVVEARPYGSELGPIGHYGGRVWRQGGSGVSREPTGDWSSRTRASDPDESRPSRPAPVWSRTKADRPVPTITLSAGDRVTHPTFGGGVVLDVSGSGSDTQVVVSFDAAGSKRLLLAYAPLDRE